MKRILRAMRVLRNPDLKWIGQNLAPKITSDRQFLSGGMSDFDWTRRGFTFDDREIEVQVNTREYPQLSVSLRQLDVPDLVFVFGVKIQPTTRYRPKEGPDRPLGLPMMMANRESDEVFDEVAARLRAFGEFYLSEPVEDFNYCTPGEYVEWPSREVIEPARDPSYVPLRDIDADIKKVTSKIYRLTGDDREAALSQMNELTQFRQENMAKTTHGRWLVRHKSELDRYWDAVGDSMFSKPDPDLLITKDPEP